MYTDILPRWLSDKDWCVCQSFSRVQPFTTPWTVALQASLSMGFSWQKYWSWLPFPSLGHLPNPRIKPWSPTLQADSLPSDPSWNPMDDKTVQI